MRVCEHNIEDLLDTCTPSQIGRVKARCEDIILALEEDAGAFAVSNLAYENRVIIVQKHGDMGVVEILADMNIKAPDYIEPDTLIVVRFIVGKNGRIFKENWGYRASETLF